MIMGLIGCYNVIKKRRIGWMIWLLSTPLALIVFLHKGLYGFIAVFLFYGYLNIKGWIEWK